MITPYAVTVDGFDDIFGVRSLEGKERLSKSWTFRVIVRVEDGGRDIEQAALGKRAVLLFQQAPPAVRAFHGIVAGVRVVARRERDACDYELKIVPRMWLLKKKRRTRIFQNIRIPDVVAAVLGEQGIASRWQLQQSYPIREYCTQYEETDYEFVTRLLAEAGIFFHFHQGGPSEGSSLVAAVTSVASAVAPGLGGLAAAMGPLVPGDSVICADDAVFYPALGDNAGALSAVLSAISTAPIESTAEVGAGVSAVVKAVAKLAETEAPPLHYIDLENVTESLTDKIFAFDIGNAVEPTAASFREYDPDRPLMNFTASAVSNTPFGNEGLDALATAATSALGALEGSTIAGTPIGTVASAAAGALGALGAAPPFLEVYDHHAPYLFPKWSHPSDEAARMLRQERRRASVAKGKSGCPDLAPGHRFTLQGHPIARLDQTFALTEVHHHGHVHEDGRGQHRVYECDFECVPANVTYAPHRQKRASVQVCLTAVVSGPPGSEIHVDAKGQIKVQFHWDRELSDDGTCSCWIRVMQPWSGPHWGMQFIPRVGMEVVVVFEGGDPDKPMVLGSLPNATHPPPFKLPEAKTRSGIRTSSSPGGKGFNEISFEDSTGQEQIYLHAQRDLDEVVESNHTLHVEGTETLKVAGSRSDLVEKNLHQIVKGDRNDEIAGNLKEVVSGDADERVTGMKTTRVEGKLHHNSRGDVVIETEADVTLRTLGSVTTVVGLRDKPRAWVTHAEGVASLAGIKKVEIRSDEELVLAVGKSSVRITKDKVEISSDAVVVKGGDAGISASKDGLALSSKGDSQLVANKLVIKTEQASMSMGKEVKVDAPKILMNSPDKASEPPPPEPEPPTTIVLKDDDGAPLAEQKYLITLDDKSQITGMTDADGKAELELKQGGEIIFPELKMKGDVPEGAPQPYVIRQGDFYDKLAFKYAFDPDKVWNDAKNADLKKKRKDPNQLHPGDILHFARSQKKPYPLSKGTSNEYRASIPTTKVDITFYDELEPFDGQAYVIEGLPKPIEGTAGEGGKVTFEAPIHVREVQVVFKKRGSVFRIQIGDMDPINETSGVRARLEHLGYLRPSAGALTEGEAEERLASAIVQFKKDHGLPPNSEIDDAFREELQKAHGS